MFNHTSAREKILEMVKNNRLTVDEGIELIKVMQSVEKEVPQDIAIIGMSGCFPGAVDVQEFWDNLAAGRDSTRKISKNTRHWDKFFLLEDKAVNRSDNMWGGLLSGIEEFDPGFFNITLAEAEMMDPRQRLFLQETWKAIEDAGYSDKVLEKKECGVVVGCQEGDYKGMFKRSFNPLVTTGSSNSILAARISYFLDLKGPGLAVDTACSSSLVAVHLACESIRQGTCEMAIAGGVSLMTTPAMVMALGQIGLFSPAGKCKAFDDEADGTVVGEAVGVVVLKPLATALKDRDHIYAVIKGSEINQDGRTNGITAPSASSQTALETKVYQKYKINPGTITYVEAHGTGTKLGDPIEVQALTNAFRKFTNKKNYCAIGSVKANIGHTMPAAGITSLVKVVCCLQHQGIPPLLNFKKANEHINFKDSPFYVNTSLLEWKTSENFPRRAAISSFGYNGTNCHLVVEEAPGPKQDIVPAVKPYHLILLAAKKPGALNRRIQDLTHWLEREDRKQSLQDISYTLNVRRSHFSTRQALVVKSVQDLKQHIRDIMKPGTTGPAREEHGKHLLDELRPDRAGGLSDIEYKKKLSALADLYIKGCDLDWTVLYEGEDCHCISLPTYPFARECCWPLAIDTFTPGQQTSGAPGPGKTEPPVLYFHCEWEKSKEIVGKRPDPAHSRETSSHILVLDVDEIFRDALAQQWENKKQITLVKPGSHYQAQENGIYEIDPGRQEDYYQLIQSLKSRDIMPDKIIYKWGQEKLCTHQDIVKQQLIRSVYSVLYLTRALMKQEPKNKIQLLYLYPGQSRGQAGPNPLYAAVSGIAATIRRENPKFVYKTVRIEGSQEVDILLQELDRDDGIEIRCSDGQRWVNRLKEIDHKNEPAPTIGLKENGVYLITGGMGGLGLVFASYLAQQVKARLVLAGRSALNPGKNAKIQELKSLGAEVIYLQVDVSRPNEVEALIASIKARFKEINGILHCAGVNRDAYVLKKTGQEIESVLAPKVYGTIYLDEATKNENLDFFLLFSSTAALLGNPGQADYAYANRFMDHFAAAREGLKTRGKDAAPGQQRRGKTLSINWPLWQDGGMKFNEQTRKMTEKVFGIKLLSTEAGINTFSKALSLDDHQLMTLQGDPRKIRQMVGVSPKDIHMEMSPPVRVDEKNEKNLQEKFQTDLVKIVSRFLPVGEKEIHLHKDIKEYGFDSILLTAVSNEINDVYDLGVTPAVFFELDEPTIAALARYLYEEYKERLTRYYGETLQEESGVEEPRFQGQPGETVPGPPPGLVDREKTQEAEPIAIIGMSGMMPRSGDLQIFWNHLEAGKNLISQVPKNRWDWQVLPGNNRSARWGGFMKEVDAFDPIFFGISPREAEVMDPQQRIFLETVWKTIEDAGYKASALSGTKTGVFVGVTNSDYAEIIRTNVTGIDPHASTGLARTFLANRISYLLNLHGPSEPVDTACSSSLAAVHRAVEALRNGSCHMAIAGGVNVLVSPSLTLAIAATGMLSPDGQCKTFDKNADGYVRGEGVGAVFLKPLYRAVADGDHIYAVIKGTAENHGGRAHSLTAPNANAQAQLLIDAYEQAQIHPGTVTYIEAHGTGTNLGDPVEINGLKKAFLHLDKKWGTPVPDRPQCGIGSVKTNIGHLESAAGIASLIKVLLALEYKKIPASINFETLNPHIELQNTPFYIVDKTRDWECIIDENKRPVPRRAGVSSFGFGGTNVHIVLEEYENDSSRDRENQDPQLIILSAREADRLKDYAQKISQFLDNPLQAAPNLTDIAYTLQEGREEMEERLALVVSGVKELQEKLTRFYQGNQEETDKGKVSRGNVAQMKSTPLIDGEEGEEFVRGILLKKNLTKLAQLWVSGTKIDWQLLPAADRPARVSLPTYPFARERYWVPGANKNHRQTHNPYGEYQLAPHTKMHILIDSNESNFEKLCWKKRFTGREFFLKGHGNILPGVVGLEMARAAGNLANKGARVKKLKNITWSIPLQVKTTPKDVYVCLYKKEDLFEFELNTLGENSQSITHARGVLQYAPHLENPSKDKIIDVDAILKRCQAGKNETEEFYRLINRDPGFQGIQELYYNQKEALSRVEIIEAQERDFSEYLLHPTLADTGIQTMVALGYKREFDPQLLYLPYVLQELEIVNNPSKSRIGYVYTRAAEDNTSSQGMKYNAWLIDRDGQVMVKMKGLSFRPIRRIPGKVVQTGGETDTTVYYHTILEKAPLKPGNHGQNQTHHQVRGLQGFPVLLFDTNQELQEVLKERLRKTGENQVILVKPGKKYQYLGNQIYEVNPGCGEDYDRLLESIKIQNCLPREVLHLWSREPFPVEENELEEQLERSIYSLFFLTRAIMKQKIHHTLQLLYLYTGSHQEIQPHYAAVTGFARSVCHESQAFTFKIVEMADNHPADHDRIPHLADIVMAEMNDETLPVTQIRCQDRERWLYQLKEFELAEETRHSDKENQTLPFKEGGTYLITGGTGSIGLIFARYIAREVKANLVLTGRSGLTPQKTSRIKEIESLGAAVLYIQSDQSRKKDVTALIKQIKSRFKKIDGILHCAGVVLDARLINKTKQEMDQVLAPKVYGTIYLDEETKDQDLDFFVLFSSSTAITGNMGQCDYAYANCFMDGFSQWRNRLRIQGKRSGITLSINFPYWKEGGMNRDERVGEMLSRIRGIKPLSTGTGLKAFEMGLSQLKSQFMVLEGDPQKIRKSFQLSHPTSPRGEPAAVSGSHISHIPGESPLPLIPAGEGLQSFQKDVLKIISDLLKIPERKIDLNENMSKYGFDSISFTGLSEKINKKYNLEITPDLLFEHPSIGSISLYLFQVYQDVLMRFYREKSEVVSPPMDVPVAEPQPKEWAEIPGKNNAPSLNFDNRSFEPIAVIGMSGVMPQSENLEIFWQNLLEGKNLVTEIPRERWDWRDYYEQPVRSPGKTNIKWGGFMKEVDKFDPLFFNISPLEAELMDPQQRIFMETAWKTIEDAGYKASSLSGSPTGVFLGVTAADYSKRLEANQKPNFAQFLFLQSNRLSYFLNLHGPSESIDTACSSSLVAVHRAVKAIQTGECLMAIAGGVNVILDPRLMVSMGNSGMLSADGKCYTFDKRANGFVRGEGVGAILLKPLRQAEADGDHIYAVIRASAVNHGGHTNSPTTPNPLAQAELLVDAYKKANIDPAAISYIETHGTATRLGDPIEINGLKKAFERLYKQWNKTEPKKPHCGLGSVKSNIGHLEAAAGLAGIIKVLLSMKYQTIPGNINFEELNPYINLADSPFYIVKESIPWNNPIDENGHPVPRRAGINSFGIGGTNACVVLEEYTDTISRQPGHSQQQGPYLIVLSAKNRERLKAYAQRYVDYLNKNGSSSPVSSANDKDLLSRIKNDLLKIAGGILKVKEAEIDPEEDMIEYGFDPVRLSEFEHQASEAFAVEMAPGIIKHYHSIGEFSRYIHNLYKARSVLNQQNSLYLPDLAYTLQVGREAMEERLALVVNTIGELKEKLTRFWSEETTDITDIPGVYQGNINKEKENIKFKLLMEGKAGKKFIETIIHERELGQLAQLWAAGIEVDWKLLYPAYTPKRISLPTYPFANQRCWITESTPTVKEAEPSGSPLKPLRVSPPGPGSQADKKSLFQEVETHVTHLITNILKLDPTSIDLDQSLLEYGFTSIILMQFINQLNETYNIQFAVESFFDLERPTIRSLAAYLHKKFANNFNQYFQETPDRPPGDKKTVEDKKTVNKEGLLHQLEDDILGIASGILRSGREGYEPSSVNEFVRRINQQFNLQVDPGSFLETPSIGTFIKNFAKDYRDRLADYYREKNEM